MNSNHGASAPTQPLPAKEPTPGTSRPLDLTVAKLTNTGRSRPFNEDYVDFYIPPDLEERARKGALYLTADGMGGHQAGELASRGAVESVRQEYYADGSPDVRVSLERAFQAANQRIYGWSQGDASKKGMGTTLVAAVILGRKVFVANVGDSRAYVVNQNGIQQITTDHSWVEEQVQAGLLTREQARKHPQRNVVTRALGTKPQAEVDLFEGQIHEGDSLLLCTDGLTGHVQDTELAAIVQEHPPEEAAQLLVDLANERGGSDNIGVVIVSAAQPQKAVVPAPTVAREAPKEGLMWRLIRAMAALAGILLCTLIVLGGYYFWRTNQAGQPTSPPVAMATTSAVPITTQTESVSVPAGQTVTLAATEQTTTITETPAGPTSTLAPVQPTSTAAPTYTPGPTSEEQTRAPSATPAPTDTPVRYPAPDLQLPPSDQELSGSPTFRWRWTGPALAQNRYFDVRIWAEAERNNPNDLKRGAVAPTKEQFVPVGLSGVPAIQEYGTGTYYWTVVVVEKNSSEASPTIIGEWGEERSFRYTKPSEGSDGEPEEAPTTRP